MRKRRGAALSTEMMGYLLGLTLLLTVGGFGAVTFMENARYDDAQKRCDLYIGKISEFKYQMGYYPDRLSDLTTKQGIYGEWILSQNFKSTDPWGVTYFYAKTDNSVAVWSSGKNKTNESGTNVPSAFVGDDVGTVGQ